jgi:hypothetical protein
MWCTTYRAWCPDHGHNEDVAKSYDGDLNDFDRVAEDYAEKHCGFSGDPFTAVDIMVREVPTNELRRITVEVQAVPHFSAENWKVLTAPHAKDKP